MLVHRYSVAEAHRRDLDELALLVGSSSRLLVLTGAGCSTESGIPDYRDSNGDWKRRPPVQYQDFVSSEGARQRYWARSMVGWEYVRRAHPNPAHRALAQLEDQGVVHHLITQNVDGLHQNAGSRKVIDLHGTIDRVGCLACGYRVGRIEMQDWLGRLNPTWLEVAAQSAPDGDADLEGEDFDDFRVPPCPYCAGVLRPCVVFFGENVPRGRVSKAFERLAEADALLVVGSSLMVFSGYRFVREATRSGKPVAIINLGRSRADAEVALKIEAPCGEALTELVRRLAPRS